jgi:hypothetical protein
VLRCLQYLEIGTLGFENRAHVLNYLQQSIENGPWMLASACVCAACGACSPVHAPWVSSRMNISQAREDDGHLNGNHAEVLIGLHDFLDAGEQVVVLEIGGGLNYLQQSRSRGTAPPRRSGAAAASRRRAGRGGVRGGRWQRVGGGVRGGRRQQLRQPGGHAPPCSCVRERRHAVERRPTGRCATESSAGGRPGGVRERGGAARKAWARMGSTYEYFIGDGLSVPQCYFRAHFKFWVSIEDSIRLFPMLQPLQRFSQSIFFLLLN